MSTPLDFDAVRRQLGPIFLRFMHLYWRYARCMTIRVRGLVFDAQGRIFLVRHGHIAGWHLPGGDVELDESLLTALTRELREESNIELIDAPDLHGIYWNRRNTRRNHVALYVVRSFRQIAPPQPNSEIMAHGFFAPDALPEDTTVSARARVTEVLGGRTAEIW